VRCPHLHSSATHKNAASVRCFPWRSRPVPPDPFLMRSCLSLPRVLLPRTASAPAPCIPMHTYSLSWTLPSPVATPTTLLNPWGASFLILEFDYQAYLVHIHQTWRRNLCQLAMLKADSTHPSPQTVRSIECHVSRTDSLLSVSALSYPTLAKEGLLSNIVL
jgi:hypothetical protein